MTPILLHACCGPCSTHCVRALRAAGFEPVLFYSNSNIDTGEEWAKRLAALRKFADAESVEVLADPWDGAEWERSVAAGFESEKEGGARCDRCFLHNLSRAAAEAAARGFGSFSTTLTVSPHKSSPRVFAAGRAAEAAAGAGKTRFEPFDFKKKGGFAESVELSRKYGLYRQSYCGCRFSKERTAGRGGGETEG